MGTSSSDAKQSLKSFELLLMRLLSTPLLTTPEGGNQGRGQPMPTCALAQQQKSLETKNLNNAMLLTSGGLSMLQPWSRTSAASVANSVPEAPSTGIHALFTSAERRCGATTRSSDALMLDVNHYRLEKEAACTLKRQKQKESRARDTTRGLGLRPGWFSQGDVASSDDARDDGWGDGHAAPRPRPAPARRPPTPAAAADEALQHRYFQSPRSAMPAFSVPWRARFRPLSAPSPASTAGHHAALSSPASGLGGEGPMIPGDLEESFARSVGVVGQARGQELQPNRVKISRNRFVAAGPYWSVHSLNQAPVARSRPPGKKEGIRVGRIRMGYCLAMVYALFGSLSQYASESWQRVAAFFGGAGTKLPFLSVSQRLTMFAALPTKGIAVLFDHGRSNYRAALTTITEIATIVQVSPLNQ